MSDSAYSHIHDLICVIQSSRTLTVIDPGLIFKRRCINFQIGLQRIGPLFYLNDSNALFVTLEIYIFVVSRFSFDKKFA